MKLSIVNLILSIVLLSSLFYVGVTSSIAVYDPYADYDQDGDIDIYDAVNVAGAYGTTGDSTRNVTVTNFPINQPDPSWKDIVIVENFNISWEPEIGSHNVETGWITVGSVEIKGYSRMVVYAYITNYTDVGGSNPLETNRAEIGFQMYKEYSLIELWGGPFVGSISWSTDGCCSLRYSKSSSPIPTDAPSLRVAIKGQSKTPSDINLPSKITCLVSIGIYLRNE